MAPTWHDTRRARERAELANRKRKQAENTDKELESALIAYHAHRVDGGQMRFEDFRREWYMTKGGDRGG